VLGPGEHFHYSNLAYALLGEVVARVSGTRFPDFVDERLIGPLGLTRTTWRAEPAALGYYVEPFARTLGPEPSLEGEGVEAVGSLWSTRSDLCRWACTSARSRRCTRCRSWTTRRLDARPRARPAARAARRPRLLRHGGAMPGFLAMLLGRARRRRARRPHERVDPGAAVEEIASTSRRRRSSSSGRPSRGGPSEPPPRSRSSRHVVDGGTPFLFWWEQGRLRARPEESDLPRHVSTFEADGADRYRVAEGRERGELPARRARRGWVDREAVLGDLPGHTAAHNVRLTASAL
jgi:CubicO group peptidase (beta-lactamase class C family)